MTFGDFNDFIGTSKLDTLQPHIVLTKREVLAHFRSVLHEDQIASGSRKAEDIREFPVPDKSFRKPTINFRATTLFELCSLKKVGNTFSVTKVTTITKFCQGKSLSEISLNYILNSSGPS